MSLLDIARRGNLPILRGALRKELDHIFRGYEANDEVDTLALEALEYAEIGDLEEATHRLRLWYEPKWGSEFECRHAYQRAMKR